VELESIISLVLGALSIGLGKYVMVAKKKTKEARDLLNKIIKAVEDDEITKAELEDIVKSAKLLINKEKKS
jgi:transcriptional regulator CtsR